MRGSIRTKVPGKVYELRVSLGKDPRTGRYRQQSVTVRGSRSDAQRALRRLLDDIESGRHQRPNGGARTFAELLDEWLAFKAAADRSPTTIARYRASIEQQLKPALGDRRLDRLDTKGFDDLYRALTIDGRRLDGSGQFRTAVFNGSYPPTGPLPTTLHFSSGGCWKLVGHQGGSQLVIYLSFSSSAPAICVQLHRQLSDIALVNNPANGAIAQATEAALRSRSC